MEQSASHVGLNQLPGHGMEERRKQIILSGLRGRIEREREREREKGEYSRDG